MIFPLLSAYSFFGESGVEWLYNWLPLTILAVITVVIIYNLFFMLARAFGLSDLEREAKSEMLQAGATALMAIFLVFFVESAVVFTGTMIYGDLSCEGSTISISSVGDAFDAIKECRVQPKAVQISKIQHKIRNDQTSKNNMNFLNFDLSFFGITVLKGNWLGDVYKSVESRRIVNNLSTSLLISLNAQSFLLSYIKINMLNVFLPLGIILRSFKFTRGVGALFIGIAIGFYFIFPVVFVLLDPGFVALPIPETPPVQPNQYCYPTMGFATSVYNTMTTESGVGTGMDTLTLNNLANSLSQTYLSLVLHPLVALFITLVFVRYMITILGGDAYSMMRMVSKVI